MAVILINKDINRCDWFGLSTDTKPTTGAVNSTFYAEDTKIQYVYTGTEWVEDNRGIPGPELSRK